MFGPCIVVSSFRHLKHYNVFFSDYEEVWFMHVDQTTHISIYILKSIFFFFL